MAVRIFSPLLAGLLACLASVVLPVHAASSRVAPAASAKSGVAREVPAPLSGVSAVCLQTVDGPHGPVLINLQSVAVIRLDTDIVRFLAANGQSLVASKAYREDGARLVFEQTVRNYKQCLQSGT